MSTFSWPVRVYYEDTDTGGVVYYANYLRFMERARTEFLRQLGVNQEELRAHQSVVFAVRSAQVEFLQPARLDDALTVSARIVELRRASLVFAQEILRVGNEGAICTAQVRVACVDAAALRPRAIPETLMQELKRGY